MTTENNSETLEEILSSAMAEEALATEGVEEAADVEAGPTDEIEDAEAGDDDVDEGELADEDEDADSDADDEDEGEDSEEGLEDDDEEDLDAESQDDDEDEPKTKSEDSVLAEVKARQEALEQELRLLRQERDELKRQAQPVAPKPAISPELRSAVKLAIFGNGSEEATREAFAEFSPTVREAAVRLAKEDRENEALRATDFEAYYHKVIGPIVDAHIAHRTRKFDEVTKQTKAERVIEKHRGYLKTKEVEGRVLKIIQTLPTAMPMTQRLDLAVELDMARSGSVTQAKAARSSKSRSRDEKASKRSRRERGRGRRRAGGKPKLADQDPNNLMADVEQLLKAEKDGRLDSLL